MELFHLLGAILAFNIQRTHLLPTLSSWKHEGWDDTSGMDFCEGLKFHSISRRKCTVGFTFGLDNPPQCICIRGIYRAYLENCDVAEGFARDVCMLPYEKLPGHTSENPRLVRVLSIQILAEPAWDKTHILIGGVGGYEMWTVFTIGIHNQTIAAQANYFYLINGQSWITPPKTKHEPQQMCIETMDDILASPLSCKVTQAENPEVWITTNILIKLRDISIGGCRTEGNLIPLKTEACMAPLLPRDSECSRSCETVVVDAKANFSQNNIVFDNKYEEREMENKALTGLFEPNESDKSTSPTVEIFKMMLKATSNFCPASFVPPEWLDYMMNLFYALYRENQFALIERFKNSEFMEIQSVLEKCIERTFQIRLTKNVGRPGKYLCSAATYTTGGVAVGYCTKKDVQCIRPILVDPIEEKMGYKLRVKHLVPEVAWSLLDATQAICFRELQKSYRLFHILEQGIEAAFNNRIKNFWYFPSPKNSAQKNRIYGKGADKKILNLEVCTGAAYHIVNSEGVRRFGPKTTLLKRLLRPRLLNQFHMKSAYNGERDGERAKAGLQQRSFNDSPKLGKYTEVYCRFSLPSQCRRRKWIEEDENMQTNSQIDCNHVKNCLQCDGEMVKKRCIGSSKCMCVNEPNVAEFCNTKEDCRGCDGNAEANCTGYPKTCICSTLSDKALAS